MRKQLTDIEQIEQYLLGTLPADALTKLENRIAIDTSFKAQVENQRLVMQAVKRNALRSDINKTGGNGNSLKWGGGAMLLVLLSVFTYLYMQNETPEPEVLTVANEYDFNGLKMWVEPDIQRFEFDASEGATIEGKDGILIIVPTDAFVDEDNKIVSGTIDFELIEALSTEDMVLYNLTTTSNGKALETGGMFYTNATQDGVAVRVNTDRPLYIEVPTKEEKDGMLAFQGEVTPEGGINWKDPQELQKFLVNVNFDFLDFLPEGFEAKVLGAEKDSRFYLETKAQIDSLYYSLSFYNEPIREANVEIEEDFELPDEEEEIDDITFNWGDGANDQIETDTFAEMDFAVEEIAEEAAVSEVVSCRGLDPLTVKTIRSGGFAQSYIATREFEERIAELHQLTDGEELIQLYIQNLTKQLWQVDQMIAKRLSGSERASFQAFADEKLTNIKDAELYAERLSAYYNEKIQAERKALDSITSQMKMKDAKELVNLRSELYALRAEASRKYDEKFRKKATQSPISSFPRPSVATSNTYAFQWSSFGWANIDRYLKLLNENSKSVKLTARTDFANVKIYQWLGAIETLTPIAMDGKSGTSLFPAEGSAGASSMARTQAIAIARTGAVYSWATVTFEPYAVDSVVLTLDSIPLVELKAHLAALNLGTDSLIKRLKNAQQLMAEDSMTRAKISHQKAKWQREQYRKQDYINSATNGKQQEIAKKEAEVLEKLYYVEMLRRICFDCAVRCKPQPVVRNKDVAEEIAEFD